MRRNMKWFILFVIFFAVFPLSYYIGGKYWDAKLINNENRIMQQSVEIDSWDNLASSFEKYYSDNLPWRNTLISLNALVSNYIYKESITDSAILGQEGWRFFKEEIPCYKGINLMTEEEIEQNINYLLEIKQKFASENCRFVVFIPPNKESIYSDMLPNYIKQVSLDRRVYQMIDYINENDIDLDIIYPRRELSLFRINNPQYQIYFKNDTHWNNLGAYVGTKELLRYLDVEIPPVTELELKGSPDGSSAYGGYDMANASGMAAFLSDTNYEIMGWTNNSMVVYEGMPYNSLEEFYGEGRTYNSQPKRESKIVFVRDSYGTAMYPILASVYREMYSIHKAYVNWDNVVCEEPDIVIYEAVERGW
ncbi:MAG: hypothetical protein ACI4F0_10210 [Agathobacter sp.]